MGELISLAKFKCNKELEDLHSISRHVNIVDDDGNVIVTIYDQLSPMAFKQRQDQLHQYLNSLELLGVIMCAEEKKPTLWQRIKNILRGGL